MFYYIFKLTCFFELSNMGNAVVTAIVATLYMGVCNTQYVIDSSLMNYLYELTSWLKRPSERGYTTYVINKPF